MNGMTLTRKIWTVSAVMCMTISEYLIRARLTDKVSPLKRPLMLFRLDFCNSEERGIPQESD